MTHHVELTRRAEVDVDGILGWLRERSPQGAAAWYGVWCEVLDKLRKQPTACGLAPEDTDHQG